MIVNRQILREHGLSEYDITRVHVICTKSNVRMYDKMTLNKNGALCPTPHFDITEWVGYQRERVVHLRSTAVAANQKLLNRVEEVIMKI